jgi:hypothetical protein
MKIAKHVLAFSVCSMFGQTPPNTAPPPSVRANDSTAIRYSYDDKGATSSSLHDVLARSLDVRDFGARCDGASHPLSTAYPSLAAAQAVYPFANALTQELDWAAIEAAQNALPVDPARKKTAAGHPVHMGRLLFPPSTCIVAETLLVSPEVSIEGTGGYGSLAQGGPASGIRLKDNTATGREYFVVAVDPVEAGADGSFGVSFKDIVIDCQGGNEMPGWTGHNSGSSGLLFYGAQGSTWNNLVVENCGHRGIAMPVGGGSGSGLAHFGPVWIAGITQGPGLDVQAATSATFALISAEHINPHGTYKDSDGDANAGIRVVQSGDVQFTQLETEHVFLPVKIGTSWNIEIEHASLGPTLNSKCPQECAGPGIKIRGGSRNIGIRKWMTYNKAPYLYSAIIEDMDNKVTLPGNLRDFPVGSYEQNSVESYLFNLRLLGESWFQNVNAKVVNATGGYEANGSPGASRTVTVKGSKGADCNLVFISGLLTSTTCP